MHPTLFYIRRCDQYRCMTKCDGCEAEASIPPQRALAFSATSVGPQGFQKAFRLSRKPLASAYSNKHVSAMRSVFGTEHTDEHSEAGEASSDTPCSFPIPPDPCGIV